MGELRDDLISVINYLTPFLPLANTHTVDFIVGNVWEKEIPVDIRLEVESVGAEAAIERLWHALRNETVSSGQSSKLFNFVEDANNRVIEKFNCIYDIGELDNILPGPVAFNHLKKWVTVTEYMSAKKIHEVHNMSHVVAYFARAMKSSIIVDIGSGKGYLPSMLALNHNLRILGIDDKSSNIDGAIRTTKMLEKKWKMYEKKSFSKCSQGDSCDSTYIDENSPRNEEAASDHCIQPTVLGISYKQRKECVSGDTDISKILSEEYPLETDHNILFVGLHTCGNLSPNSLKLFIACDRTVKAIINIGCCYHLIDEEFSSNPSWHCQRIGLKTVPNGDYGFPLSQVLKELKFSLGRDARMCGTQNPLKIFKNQELMIATKPLFYRALLQKILVLKCGPSNLPEVIVGRMAHKCSSFTEYATKAFKKLNLSIQMSPVELDKYESDHELDWQRLKIFFLLKTALSRVIETVILLDKLVHLYEQGIEMAFVSRLFDPVISPRCYAVVAINGIRKP